MADGIVGAKYQAEDRLHPTQEALEVRQISSGTAWEAAASVVYWGGHALIIRAEVQPIFVGRSGDELRFANFS